MDITEFEHPSITDENREDFGKHMEKFATMEDAALDGMALKKITGTPYRLPKSLDNLPDDNSRKEFKAGYEKLAGITHLKSIDDLADTDPRFGLTTKDHPVDEGLFETFKQFAVDNDMSKGDFQKIIGVHNASIEKALAGNIANNEAMKKYTADELAKRPEFGTPDKVKAQSDLVKTAIRNNLGLTPEEYKEIGPIMEHTLLNSNPIMARVAINAFAHLAAESSNDGGGGGDPPAAPIDPEEGSPTYMAQGWSTPEQAAAYNKRNAVN